MFVVQPGRNESDVWIANSGASCHMTHDGSQLYNLRPPAPDRETITIEDRPKIKIESIGNMDVISHGQTDKRITLIDVVYVPGLGFNLYSLHAVQNTHLLVSNASGAHMIGTDLAFPHSSSGSYFHSTRLPAGTVGTRKMQRDMRATNLLRQLRHPVLTPPLHDVTRHYSEGLWTTPVWTVRINHRGISTSPCRSLCPSPRHLLHQPPLRQLPHW